MCAPSFQLFKTDPARRAISKGMSFLSCPAGRCSGLKHGTFQICPKIAEAGLSNEITTTDGDLSPDVITFFFMCSRILSMGSGRGLVPSPPLRMCGSRVRSCIHTFATPLLSSVPFENVPPSFGNSCGGTFPREDGCPMKDVGHDEEERMDSR